MPDRYKSTPQQHHPRPGEHSASPNLHLHTAAYSVRPDPRSNLSLLSLPLPAPPLTRQGTSKSDESDLLQTPHMPTPPAALPGPQHQHPNPSLKSVSEFPFPPTPVHHPHHPQSSPNAPRTATASLSAEIAIRQLAEVIEDVYTQYTRQDQLLQSPIILDALAEFSERASELQTLISGLPSGNGQGNGQGTVGRGTQPSREGKGVPEEMRREIKELEEEWWSSAVVANWFGPQPHTVKRQKSRRRRKARKPSGDQKGVKGMEDI